MPEAVSSVLLYHFSGGEGAVGYPVLRWLAVFPLTGLLWVYVLGITAPAFGGRAIDYSYTVLRFAYCSIPMAFLAPVAAFFAARSGNALYWSRFVDVVLQQTQASGPGWLRPAFFVAAGLGLVFQLRLYTNVFDTHGGKLIGHLFWSLLLTVASASGIGAVAGAVAQHL